MPTHPEGHLPDVETRGHRDELIALVVVLLLTATVLGVIALLGHDGDEAPDTAAGAGPAAASSTEAQASEDPTEPVDAAPLVGTNPFVYACRLVPRSEVQRIFGSFGPDARTRQTYLSRTLDRGESADPALRAPGGLTTSCEYTFADPAAHTLELSVTQLATAGALERRWARLASEGRVVPRTDDRMLTQPQRRSFALRGDGFTAEVRYSTFGDAARTRPLSAHELAWQLPRMRQILASVSGSVADGTATSGPQPTNAGLGSGVAGTPYVEPCLLLTDPAFAALGGAPAGPVDVDSSYVPRDPYADAPMSSCERRGTTPGARPRDDRTTLAVLEVRLAADSTSAEEVQAKHLDNRYTPQQHIDRVSTSAGPAYVVDVGGTKAWPWHTRAIHVVVGNYEVFLSALLDVRAGHLGSWVSKSDLVAAADQVIDVLESTAG